MNISLYVHVLVRTVYICLYMITFFARISLVMMTTCVLCVVVTSELVNICLKGAHARRCSSCDNNAYYTCTMYVCCEVTPTYSIVCCCYRIYLRPLFATPLYFEKRFCWCTVYTFHVQLNYKLNITAVESYNPEVILTVAHSEYRIHNIIAGIYF